MSRPTRRQFLGAAAVAAAAPALAIDPIKRPSNKPDLKLSLAAYSFRDELNLKKPKMTLLIAIPIGDMLAPKHGASHAQEHLAA